jgi:hypothetical protein
LTILLNLIYIVRNVYFKTSWFKTDVKSLCKNDCGHQWLSTKFGAGAIRAKAIRAKDIRAKAIRAKAIRAKAIRAKAIRAEDGAASSFVSTKMMWLPSGLALQNCLILIFCIK